MRDYLNSHEEDAREYSELKKRLAAEYPEDRNTYTEKKSALINEILKKAAAWRNSLNHSLLKSTQNTRTLLTGSYRYIRSDVPGSLTDDEVRWLYQNGITTIVDLRSEGEFLRKPCRLEHEEGFTYFKGSNTSYNNTLEIINNTATIENLNYGKYYLKEEKAGVGYNLDTNTYEIILSNS